MRKISKEAKEDIRTMAAVVGILIGLGGLTVGLIALHINVDNYDLTKELRMHQHG